MSIRDHAPPPGGDTGLPFAPGPYEVPAPIASFSNASLNDVANLQQRVVSGAQTALPPVILHELESEVHVVKPGETLSGIAQQHLGKDATAPEIYKYVNEIGKANHIPDVNRIYPGEIIVFPPEPGGGKHQPPPEQKPKDQPTLPANPKQKDPSSKGEDPASDKPKKEPEKPKEEHHGGGGIFGFFGHVADDIGHAADDVVHAAEGVGRVVKDVGGGVVDEVIHHPGELLKDAAIGAGIAIGATLLAPEVAIGAAVVGVGLGAYEVAKNAGKWGHAISVVYDPNGHSKADQQQAEATLHGIGEGTAQLAAGLAGGGAGAFGAKLIAGAAGAEVGAEGSAVVQAADRAPAVETTAARTAGETTGGAPEATAVAPASDAAAADAGDAAPMQRVSVEKTGVPGQRVYRVGDNQYNLQRLDQAWYYGKYPNDLSDVGPVKLHVTVNGPEDLAQVQRVLVPFLNDDPAASQLTTGWKTFDPLHAVGEGEPPDFVPGETGQNAKGFTIYTRSGSDAAQLQGLVDRALSENGLGLDRPINTGNVDSIAGETNRVGSVRDYYPPTAGADGSYGIKLDSELAQRIAQEYGQGGQLSAEQLQAVEEQVGLRPGTLQYDRDGQLMLRTSPGGPPENGQVYVSESGAGKSFGSLTDRPAIYALSRAFGWDPIQGAN